MGHSPGSSPLELIWISYAKIGKHDMIPPGRIYNADQTRLYYYTKQPNRIYKQTRSQGLCGLQTDESKGKDYSCGLKCS
jgi:hypothetical protein